MKQTKAQITTAFHKLLVGSLEPIPNTRIANCVGKKWSLILDLIIFGILFWCAAAPTCGFVRSFCMYVLHVAFVQKDYRPLLSKVGE